MTDLMELFRHWHAGRSHVSDLDGHEDRPKDDPEEPGSGVGGGLTLGEGGKFDEMVWRELIARWLVRPLPGPCRWPSRSEPAAARTPSRRAPQVGIT